ncbi:hypothetical protein V1477_004470 [Vespula maculifrons]|uniref:Uncharacterized protein n=1 Tax=Vespula maculifrons TaxID=7453 RepID=A0ABD2CRN0_VESMC
MKINTRHSDGEKEHQVTNVLDRCLLSVYLTDWYIVSLDRGVTKDFVKKLCMFSKLKRKDMLPPLYALPQEKVR